MKKTYDRNVRVLVTVSNNQRKVDLLSSIHNNIHQLKIELAKILGISILDSNIDFYNRGERPLKPTSTLLQNEIETDCHLTANISRLKVVEHIDLNQNKGKSKQQTQGSEVQMLGLSVISSCTNGKCVNYNQDVEINYGFGNFPILELTAFTKCEICPYKSQYLRPSMMCKSIKVNRCLYKLKGTELNNCGIPIPKETSFIKTQKQKQIQQLLQQNPWHINMQLIIKQL